MRNNTINIYTSNVTYGLCYSCVSSIMGELGKGEEENIRFDGAISSLWWFSRIYHSIKWLPSITLCYPLRHTWYLLQCRYLMESRTGGDFMLLWRKRHSMLDVGHPILE